MDKEKKQIVVKIDQSQVEMELNKNNDSSEFQIHKSQLNNQDSKSYSNELDHLYDQYETNANSNKKQQTEKIQKITLQQKKQQPQLIENSNQSDIISYSLDSSKKNQLEKLYLYVQVQRNQNHEQNNILSLDKQLQDQINKKREESQKQIQNQKLLFQMKEVKQQSNDIKKLVGDLNISSIVVIQKSSLEGQKHLFEILLLSEVPEKFRKAVELIQQTNIKAVLRFNFQELSEVSKQEIDQFIQLLYRKKQIIQKYVFEIKVGPQTPFYLIQRNYSFGTAEMLLHRNQIMIKAYIF